VCRLADKLIKSNIRLSNLLVPVPTVVTTFDKSGNPNAFTLSHSTNIHWEPPTILISVDPNNKSLINIRNTKRFTMNVLGKSKSSMKIANAVGYLSGNVFDKFKELSYLKRSKLKTNDVWPPVLDVAILALHCELIKEYEYNGISLCIGEIKEAFLIKELKNIEETEDRSKLWRAFEEKALTHADLYEYLQ
jgi:flavin reductase (DIM6/NTAB) family NADH-FMN oxidoreductase RutF